MTTRKNYFNNLAENWDKNHQTKELLSFLEKFVPQFSIKPNERVIDIGTGTGILIPFLLKAVGSSGHITAIDFASNMVEICRSKYLHFPNVNVVCQQVEDLDLPSESFDSVVCFGVFPHITNKDRALFQVNRVLRTGGKLIIAHALSSQQIREHHQNASSVVATDELPMAEEMEKLLKRHCFGITIVIDKPGMYLNLSFKLYNNDEGRLTTD